MNSSDNITSAGDGDGRCSPALPTTLAPTPLHPESPVYTPTSPTLLASSPASPAYSPASPTTPQPRPGDDGPFPSSPSYSSSTQYPPADTRLTRKGLHPRGDWELDPFTQEWVDKNTYQGWIHADMMRLEDANILAVCSGTFSANKRSPTQSSNLFNLPTELQDEVFRNVDRKGLNALSQTCVAMRAAMRPFILGHVILTANSPRLHQVVQTLENTISKSKEVAGMIRALKLTDDDTLSDILARLLPFTTKLNSLVYGYDIRYSSVCGVGIIDAQAFTRSLEPVRHSLTDLRIYYDQWDNFADPAVDGWCCLKDMVALKTLETGFIFLLGRDVATAPKLADVLPPGLVELRVHADPHEVHNSFFEREQRLEAFAELLRDKTWERFTPNLKLLSYYDMYSAADAMDPTLAKLVRDNGLECDSQFLDPCSHAG